MRPQCRYLNQCLEGYVRLVQTRPPGHIFSRRISMLLPQTELTVYSNQINLTLLNDIVAFVLSSSEATQGQRRALSEHCLLSALINAYAFPLPSK